MKIYLEIKLLCIIFLFPSLYKIENIFKWFPKFRDCCVYILLYFSIYILIHCVFVNKENPCVIYEIQKQNLSYF